jgi:hypothetical protein
MAEELEPATPSITPYRSTIPAIEAICAKTLSPLPLRAAHSLGLSGEKKALSDFETSLSA